MYDHVGFIAELFGQIKMQLLMRTGQCLRKALQHRYNRLCLHNNKSLAKLRFLRISICNPRRHLKTCTSRESMEVRFALTILNFANLTTSLRRTLSPVCQQHVKGMQKCRKHSCRVNRSATNFVVLGAYFATSISTILTKTSKTLSGIHI